MSFSARRSATWLLLIGLSIAGCAARSAAAKQTAVLSAAAEARTRCSATLPAAPVNTTPPAAALPLMAAVALDGAQSSLVVVDVQNRRTLWRKPLALDARPQILGDLVATTVATTAGDELNAFDALTGAQRVRAALPRPAWLGASQLGDLLVSTTNTLSWDPATRGSTVSAYDTHSGARRWERSFGSLLGQPSCIADRCYLISDRRELHVLRAADGSELGCSLFAGAEVEWLRASSDGVWYGAASSAWSLASTASLELGAGLPGRPQLEAAYGSVPATRTAHGRIAVAASLTATPAGPALAGDRYFYVFYRDLFAFDAHGNLVWARSLPKDAVRMQAASAGLVVVDEAGTLQVFDPSNGAALASLGVGATLTSAALAINGLTLTAAPVEPAPVLRASLTQLAIDPDARLLPVRTLAVDALAALADPAVTQDLLDVYGQPSTPATLRKHIANVLTQRSAGREYLLDALLVRADFLDDRRTAPVGMISTALAVQHVKEAVPRLVDRLFDPDVAMADLASVVSAIERLGEPAAVSEPLERFLTLYRGDSAFSADPSALLLIAQWQLDHADAAGRARLAVIAQDEVTLPGLAKDLQLALATRTATAAQLAAASQPSAATPTATATTPATQLPATLSQAAIVQTFGAHAGELRKCVLAELGRNPKLVSIRVSLVVERSGKTSAVRVTPDTNELRTCLADQVASYRFPAFAQPRRLASYTIALRASPSVTTAAETPDAEFWHNARAKASPQPSAAGMAAASKVEPWWRDQNPLFVSIDPTTNQEAVVTPPVSAPARVSPSLPGTTNRNTATLPTPATTPAATSSAPAPAAADDAWWLPAH